LKPNIAHEDIVIYQTGDYMGIFDQKVCAVRCDDGATLKKVELDPEHNRIVLIPFNSDFKFQIINEDQGVDPFLIGVLSVQVRLFYFDKLGAKPQSLKNSLISAQFAAFDDLNTSRNVQNPIAKLHR
jgi:hypothetical protein